LGCGEPVRRFGVRSSHGAADPERPADGRAHGVAIDEARQRAFPRAEFTAGRADGRPVSVMVQFTLRFAGKLVEERWDSFCQLVAGH